MKKALLIALMTSSASTGVLAQESSDFEAYLGASHYFWDSERNLDDANGFDLGAELPVSESLSLEAWLSQVDADIKNSSAELEGERYSGGGLYHFTNGDLRPFVSLGLGHQEFENSTGDSNDETLAYIGAGVKKYFDNNLLVRAELLGMNSIDNELTDVAARIAIGYAFGRKASGPVAEAVETYVEPVAQKAEEATEDATAKAEEPKPVVAETVEAEPAPQDSDLDGVVDALDQCAGTNSAYQVDDSGCPVMLKEPVSIKLNVKFPTNSTAIDNAGLLEIKRVADFMQQFDETTVTVEGHTDDRGRAAYNKSLSQKRADAVRTALINEFNIAGERVKAVGYGEEQPVADNATAEGRALNRRVVAVVEGEAERPAVK